MAFTFLSPQPANDHWVFISAPTTQGPWIPSTTPAATSPSLVDCARLLDVAVSRLFLLFEATGLYPVPQNAPFVSPDPD